MSFTLPENLPSIRTATLPDTYVAAKVALKQCVDLDECAEWENRAAAMATYAKMADDDDLMNNAIRVRAWAIRRCGELLQTFEGNKGGRPSKETYTGNGTGFSQTQAAEDAGLSKRKKDTALRLATIPEEEFTEAIESDAPPTITALAEQGTVKRYRTPAEIIGDRDPADFQASIHAGGGLSRFVEMTQHYDPAAIVRGSDARERARMRQDIAAILPWVTALTDRIEEEEKEEQRHVVARE